MTVCTSPSGKIDLHDEVKLLKSALLYADRVRLCSITSSMLVLFQQIGNYKPIELVRIFAQGLNNPELLQFIALHDQINSKKHRSRDEIIKFRKIELEIEKFREQALMYFEAMAEKAGMKNLKNAQDAGLLEMEIFDGDDSDALAAKFLSSVISSITTGNTYPIFDNRTSKLIKSLVDEKILTTTPVQSNRSKQVSLPSDLLRRLPFFDEASIDEIIDIRRELDKPLIRFRSAMIAFSQIIETASWDEEFPFEAERIFHQYVAPAVLEIEEDCRANSFLRGFLPNLIGNIVEKPALPATGSAIYLVLGPAAGLPDIVAAGLSFSLGSSVLLSKTLSDWREKTQEIERNQMYFYYQSRQKLGSS
ncbi:MAG: hypothetical protein HY862_05545 [Chloroflexi bacterium]|nr:hypothetical protein [Chloroflexota bacterium]